MDFTIIGAGAIGGSIGGLLARAGHAIRFVDADEDHVRALNVAGLKVLDRNGEPFHAEVSAVTPEQVDWQITRAIVAVKAQHDKDVAHLLAERAAVDAEIAVMQNGIGAFDVARIVGGGRVFGALVNIAADYIAPGKVQMFGFGSLVLGELNGDVSERVERWADALRPVGGVEVSDNIEGLLWTKLGQAAMLTVTALSNVPQLDAMLQQSALTVAAASEVYEVARAAGVRLVDHDSVCPAAFAPGIPLEEGRRVLEAMVEFQRPHQKSHSGIWRDLAVRHRKTEVHAHFDQVFAVAEKQGVPVPLLRKLDAQIHEIERGDRQQTELNYEELRS